MKKIKVLLIKIVEKKITNEDYFPLFSAIGNCKQCITTRAAATGHRIDESKHSDCTNAREKWKGRRECIQC